MPDEPFVSVRGEATLEVEPEQAKLTVTVRAQDKSRDRALVQLQERSSRILAAIRAFGDAVESVETTSVRLQLQYRDGRASRERIEGYIAQLAHTVTVVDFAVLGDVVARVADDDAAEVTGPYWSLRRDSDVYRHARVKAVTEAVTRAEQYAGALGARITGLLHLADAGLLGDVGFAAGGPVPPPMAMPAAAGGAARTADAVRTVTLEPQRQVVRAVVEARFTVTPPAFSSGRDSP